MDTNRCVRPETGKRGRWTYDVSPFANFVTLHGSSGRLRRCEIFSASSRCSLPAQRSELTRCMRNKAGGPARILMFPEDMMCSTASNGVRDEHERQA